MSFGFMFLYREFQLLDDDVKLLALVVRVGLGLVYGWLAWLAARGLLRAGVDPQRIGAG
jgi:cation transporter-like permease